MRVINFWRQVAAVLRHAAYPKTPAEHWEEQAKHHKPAPQAVEEAVNAACKDHGDVVEVEAHGRTWYSGPPPHVGWWNASAWPKQAWAPITWRWWDGKRWALCREVGSNPYQTKLDMDGIFWNDYYPEDAVVPRMTPEQWKERARASS